MAMKKKLLPDRYPTADFFVADILDASPKDDMATMEHPMFSLATRPDMEPRHYEHNGNRISLTPSSRGLPTIWDKDILIYCISQLMEGINRGKPPSRTLRIRPYDLMVSTNRETGGDHYKRLKAGFIRLRDSKISTNIKTDGKYIESEFGYLSEWTIIKEDEHGRMEGVEVVLPKWIYNAVIGAELLTIDRGYFRLRKGLERRLYELARKHCGYQPKWPVSMELLHKKSGSKSPLKMFRLQTKEIVENNILPDYRMRYDSDKDQVTFFNRKGVKAAKAEFDDAIKSMFQPTEKKRRKSKRPSKAQIELKL